MTEPVRTEPKPRPQPKIPWALCPRCRQLGILPGRKATCVFCTRFTITIRRPR